MQQLAVVDAIGVIGRVTRSKAFNRQFTLNRADLVCELHVDITRGIVGT